MQGECVAKIVPGEAGGRLDVSLLPPLCAIPDEDIRRAGVGGTVVSAVAVDPSGRTGFAAGDDHCRVPTEGDIPAELIQFLCVVRFEPSL